LVINGKGDMINREDIRNRSHESYWKRSSALG